MKLNKISKSFFINLDRRTDRLDHIYKNTPFFTERFPAIDSKSLELTYEIRNLFPNGFYLQRKKSEIACCLSHYTLWKQLAEDEDADNYLILEDDVVFEKGFTKFWNSVWSHSMPSDYSLIYLGGCQPVNKPVYHKVLKPYNNHFNNVKPNNLWQGRTADDHYWHMTTSSYIISKQCASLICEWVDKHGFHKVLDVFMIDFVNKLFASPDKLFHLNPLMARQLHEENDNMELDKNSDLRFDTDKFTEKTNSSYDICFCCDSNLIEYAINPINALCQQNTNNNINIHFIYSGKESDLKYIEAFISNKPNISLNKYIVNELNIPTNETWRSIGHLSNATNLKLQIPEILKDVSRVIYFDIDTIPYVDLSCFDKVSTESCGIAMRKEIKNGWRTFNGSKGTATENKNPIPFGDRVIGNSGVMVLDLVTLRKDNFTKFCLNEKGENNYNISLTGGDQDLINIFCQCNFDILPEELNILVADQLNSINRNTFEFKNFDCFQQNGVHCLSQKNIHKSSQAVLHFIGKEKPWNSDCLGSEFWSQFNAVSSKIPKKIFQTWKTKDLNQGLSFLSKSFRDKNPEYEYFLYDDDDCRRLINENFDPIVLEVYDRIIPGAFKADLWRYCALYIEGGIFCDMDMICMKNFDVIIHDDVEFFAPIDSNSRGAHDLYNAFMGSIPGHPILKRCIDTIVDNVINETWRKKKQLPLDFSACGVLGRCVNSYIGREDFSSFAGQMGVHNSVKVLNYVKDHRYVEDKGGGKYVLSKDGDEQIRMITKQAEKEYKAEPWILSLAGGKMPYNQKNSINFHKESDTDLKTKQNEFIKLKNEWQKFQKYNFLDFVAKNLPKREVPQEKYTCYNPGQKIGIVSLYTPEISEYAIESEISIRDYAFKQGYTFHVYRDRLDKESHPNWSKSHAILNHFDNHETIVWMDSDTIIFNPNQKFENILSECVPIKKIIACEDIGANSMLNSGVIIFRNHKYTKNLIKKWKDFHGNKSELYSSGGDQEVFCDILKRSDPHGNNRKIFPMSKFNTDPRFVDNETFIMHFMAYGNSLKSVFMRYWGSK